MQVFDTPSVVALKAKFPDFHFKIEEGQLRGLYTSNDHHYVMAAAFDPLAPEESLMDDQEAIAYWLLQRALKREVGGQ